MGYTNSPLVSHTHLSPNHSGFRSHSIDRISVHCVVGQCSVETLGNIFAPVSRGASSNYGVGVDGRIGMYVEECNHSWCTSSSANDKRAVTIECASDTYAPYKFNDTVYNSLILLCKDICERNGKDVLLWFGDKNTTLNYDPKPNEMVLTVHRWFAAKSCPGDWMYDRMDNLAKEVTALLGGKEITNPDKQTVPTEAAPKATEAYIVQVKADILNVRKGPGTNYGIATSVKYNEVYTIIEEAEGPGASMWGKLKSGAGWISLDYTDKYSRSSYIDPASTVQETKSKFPYVVKVTANVLNVRKGPGVNYAITTQIKKNEKYTIVEEANGSGANLWGKLKSGAGYISLDYTVKA